MKVRVVGLHGMMPGRSGEFDVGGIVWRWKVLFQLCPLRGRELPRLRVSILVEDEGAAAKADCHRRRLQAKDGLGELSTGVLEC